MSAQGGGGDVIIPAIQAVGETTAAGITASSNKKSQARAQEFNSAEAQKNRDFQSQQSATSYARAVKDMRKAGLNPAMMYGGGSGSGASTPSGSSASTNAMKFDFAGMANAMGNAIGSALAIKNTVANIDKKDEETEAVQLDNQIRKIKIPAITAEMKLQEETSKMNQFYIELDAIQKRADTVLKAGSSISDATLQGAKNIYKKGKDLLKSVTNKEGLKNHLKNFKKIFGFDD